jgi:hypothetical protein
MREIGQYMNRTHPGAPVFLADGSQLSAFNAEVYSNGWHEYNISTQIWGARGPVELAHLLDRWKVHYIAAPKPDAGIKIEPVVLQGLLDRCVTPEYQTTSLFLARIDINCQPPSEANREPLLALPGLYDDTDPAIAYRGAWIRQKGWPQTYAHTITFINTPGAQIRFAFQGGALTYFYTKAANRGRADIVIDGERQATLDLYSPEAEWQSRTTLKVAVGRHLAVITIRPDKDPKSSDRFVDMDAFVVQ